MRLYNLACTVIETMTQLVETQDASGTTSYIQKMLVLAAFDILRIARSHLSSTVDVERGRKAYFALIVYCRTISIQDSDLPSRTAVILTQLWTSKRAFLQSDGTIDSLTLHCRSRLSMSVVFDCFWRWRREFAGQTTPYNETGNVDKGIVVGLAFKCKAFADHICLDGNGPNTLLSQGFPAPDPESSKYTISSWSPQGTFPDYDWAASLEFPIETWNIFPQDIEMLPVDDI